MNWTFSKGRLQDRKSYWWLVVTAVLGFFTIGAWTIPLAVWLAPVFTVRFLRTQPIGSGLLLNTLVNGVIAYIGLRGVVPIPGVGYAIFIGMAALLSQLPYLADRWMAPRISGFVATLVLPLAVTGMEYLNSFGEFGSFGSIAYTQADNLPLIQLVSVTGIWGVTFLMTWFATVANWAWEQGFEWARVRRGVALYAGVLVLVLALGSARIALAAPSGETTRVATVTSSVFGGIQGSDKQLLDRLVAGETLSEAELGQLRAALDATNTSLLARSAEEAAAGAQLVFWAEGNGAVLREDEAALIERGAVLAREYGIYLGMGAAVLHPGVERPLENKVLLIAPSDEVVMEYRKRHPVPGGEALVSQIGDGTIPTTETPFGRLASVICFDMDFPAYMRQAGQAGVGLLVAPSNDWPEVAVMHATMARFRAIENGFTLLRPASNGISVATDYTGRVLGTTNGFTTSNDVMVAQIPTQGTATFYSRIGDLFAWLSLAGMVGMFLWVVGTSRRRATQPTPAPAPMG